MIKNIYNKNELKVYPSTVPIAAPASPYLGTRRMYVKILTTTPKKTLNEAIPGKFIPRKYGINIFDTQRKKTPIVIIFITRTASENREGYIKFMNDLDA